MSTELIKTLRERTGAGVIDCRNALAQSGGLFDAAEAWLRAKGASRAETKSDRVADQGLVAVAIDSWRGALIELNCETDFVARNALFREHASTFARHALDADNHTTLLAHETANGIVRDRVMQLAATIGENIVLRRSAAISVGDGVVAHYVHGAVAPGLGRVGVLVALESRAYSETLLSLGRSLAMHIAAAAPIWISSDDIPAEVLATKRSELSADAARSGKSETVIEKMIEGRFRKFRAETVLLEQGYVLDPEVTLAAVLAKAEEEIGQSVQIAGFVRFKTGEGAR